MTLADRRDHALNMIASCPGLGAREALELANFTDKQIEKLLEDEKFLRDVYLTNLSRQKEILEGIDNLATRAEKEAVRFNASKWALEELNPDKYRRDIQNTKLSATEQRKQLAQTTGINISIGSKTNRRRKKA